jgi:hypothetical protein
MVFEEWLKTKQGIACKDDRTHCKNPYLTNRLYSAFNAGIEEGEEGTRLQKTCEWYEQKLRDLRRQNKLLSRENNKLKKSATLNLESKEN